MTTKIISIFKLRSIVDLLGTVWDGRTDIDITPSVPDKESAMSLSAVVNSAVSLLAEYNLRLSEELEKRRKVAAMLRDFAQAQRDLAKQAEARLEVSIGSYWE